MAEKYGSIKSEIEVRLEKARLNGQWFIHTRGGKWITPDEFEAICLHELQLNPKVRPYVLDDYEAADPKKGIKGRMMELNKDMYELEVFTNRVMEYFNLQQKDQAYREKYHQKWWGKGIKP